MMKTFLFAAATALAATTALPAAAQAPTNDRKLVIYGDDRCPAGTICVRAPETERYRIPKSIRESEPGDAANNWGSRGASVASAGAATGTGSCTATGAGSWTGCWAKQMKDAKAERKVKKEEDMYPQK